VPRRREGRAHPCGAAARLRPAVRLRTVVAEVSRLARCSAEQAITLLGRGTHSECTGGCARVDPGLGPIVRSVITSKALSINFVLPLPY
jgi:hypothetical protein